jgi:uncharacterized protein
LIVERGNKDLAGKLSALAAGKGRGAAHAVHALAGLGALEPATVAAALKSDVRAVQRAGIGVATPVQLKEAYVTGGTVKVDDDRELAEVLVSLSRLPENDAELGTALFNLITKEESRITEEVTLKDAWLIAAHRHAASVTAASKAAGYTGEAMETRQMPNLMPNPGFNEVVDGKPVGWTEVRVYGDGTPFESKSTPDGRNGTPGLMLSSDKTTDGGAIVNLRVKPGTRYRLTAWAKAVNLQPAGEGLGTMLFVEGGDRSTSVKGNTDWTQLTAELESGDRSRLLVHCLIGAFGGATGTVIYDDISLTEIPGASGAKGFLGELAAKSSSPAAPVVERKFKPDAEVHTRGAAIYSLTCVACHQPTGAGLENAFPPLDGSDWLTGDPTLPIRIVIGGLQGPVKVSGKDFNAVMPPHVDLDDQKISDVLTFVRQSWSNDAAAVTPEQVKEVRDKIKDRTAPWTAAELGR